VTYFTSRSSVRKVTRFCASVRASGEGLPAGTQKPVSLNCAIFAAYFTSRSSVRNVTRFCASVRASGE
jgi:hypothetical protein